MDAPVRSFLARLWELSAGKVDLGGIGQALAELAADTDYFAPMIAGMNPDDNGGVALHVAERGPRLLFLHRPRGVMSAVHSHGTWVAIACVQGVETHRRYEVGSVTPPDRAEIRVAEEVRLAPGAVATMSPPDDIHSHGHTLGNGEAPYSLILVGDDQTRLHRREYDVPAGRYRDLPPGEFGTFNLPLQTE